MKYRKLDANGDYSFGHQSADFWIDQPDAVRQAVETRLNLWVGDWFLDTAEGTDWRAKVLGRYTTTTYDPEVRSRILGTKNVTTISQYYSTLDNTTRNLNVAAVVDTIYSGKTPQNFILSTTIAPPGQPPVIIPPPIITPPDTTHLPLGEFVLGNTELGA